MEPPDRFVRPGRRHPADVWAARTACRGGVETPYVWLIIAEHQRTFPPTVAARSMTPPTLVAAVTASFRPAGTPLGPSARGPESRSRQPGPAGRCSATIRRRTPDEGPTGPTVAGTCRAQPARPAQPTRRAQ